ncbi:hypothetical protein HanLR1_Chr01g0014471 [Helianthus annuus]|nr:hypothetical protein HanHA89_Chr01g0015531 [Helianthus annuus]KAJ0782981.1 hypothetical protein HanLR1_Chr01g0014471 [Helianthus annuus]
MIGKPVQNLNALLCFNNKPLGKPKHTGVSWEELAEVHPRRFQIIAHRARRRKITEAIGAARDRLQLVPSSFSFTENIAKVRNSLEVGVPPEPYGDQHEPFLCFG